MAHGLANLQANSTGKGLRNGTESRCACGWTTEIHIYCLCGQTSTCVFMNYLTNLVQVNENIPD
jgi:hypothetical protein